MLNFRDRTPKRTDRRAIELKFKFNIYTMEFLYKEPKSVDPFRVWHGFARATPIFNLPSPWQS
jgi:hypothetical protein